MADTEEGRQSGYGQTKGRLGKRVARIEGQVRGVGRMIEEERYCIDVLQQISAARAALDKVALELVDDHVRRCVMDAPSGAREEMTQELLTALGRLVGSR